MFYQVSFLPQMKPNSIISNKHGIHKLSHELSMTSYEYWKHQGNPKMLLNESLVHSLPAKIKILLKLAKNYWKAEIKIFP